MSRGIGTLGTSILSPSHSGTIWTTAHGGTVWLLRGFFTCMPATSSRVPIQTSMSSSIENPSCNSFPSSSVHTRSSTSQSQKTASALTNDCTCNFPPTRMGRMTLVGRCPSRMHASGFGSTRDVLVGASTFGHNNSQSCNTDARRDERHSTGEAHIGTWVNLEITLTTCEHTHTACNGLAIWPTAANPNRMLPSHEINLAPLSTATSLGCKCRHFGKVWPSCLVTLPREISTAKTPRSLSLLSENAPRHPQAHL